MLQLFSKQKNYIGFTKMLQHSADLQLVRMRL